MLKSDATTSNKSLTLDSYPVTSKNAISSNGTGHDFFNLEEPGKFYLCTLFGWKKDKGLSFFE